MLTIERLETSIDVLCWLALQWLAMKGRDESDESSNQGNFLEFLKLLASYNKDVVKVVLKKSTYTS